MTTPTTLSNSGGRQLSFVLCDQSTLADASHGGPLTPAVLQTICDAVSEQMNGEFRTEWGGTYSFRVGKGDASDVQPNEVACVIKDSLKEAPGAAAYHTTLPNGAPVCYFAREDYTSHLDGSESLCNDVSHECCETAGDPGGNRWSDQASGQSEKALETCDQVQNSNYRACNGATVSNWLLQSAFDPGAAGPWDYLKVMTSQDDYSQGYMITRVVDQQAADQQPGSRGRRIVVLGAPRPRQKNAHHSRAGRRLA
jgi:hypothetical protein